MSLMTCGRRSRPRRAASTSRRGEHGREQGISLRRPWPCPCSTPHAARAAARAHGRGPRRGRPTAGATSSVPRSPPSRRSSPPATGCAHAVGVGQRHRRADAGAARAGRRPRRRGRRALLHVLRERRGDPADRARRPSSATSTRRRFTVTPDTVRAGPDRRGPRRSSPSTCSATRRRSRRSRRSASRCSRTPPRPPAPTLGGRPAGSLGAAGHVLVLPVEEPGVLRRRRAPSSTDDEAVADAVRMLRFHGSRDKRHVRGRSGVNSRLDALQAAILRVMLPSLPGVGRGPPGRRARLRGGGARRPRDAARRRRPGAEPAWHLYVVRHPRADALAARAGRARHRGARATTGRPMHRQPAHGGLAAAGPDSRPPRRRPPSTSRCP